MLILISKINSDLFQITPAHKKSTHVSLFSDQRDYICEYCARAFKSSHNLAVHRMIHTGEKPIQCV